MHIVVTDLLTCPRCGPDFGLILLADRIEARRVLEGSLGCSNCRDRFPIRDGAPDLRLGPPEPDWTPSSGDEDRALRIAALLGVGHAPGTILLHGADAGLLTGVGALLPNARVIGSAPGEVPGASAAGLDWLRIGDTIPMRTGSLRAVAFVQPPGEALLAEALRALVAGAHLVVDPAPADVARHIAAAGANLLLDQDGAAVASHRGPR